MQQHSNPHAPSSPLQQQQRGVPNPAAADDAADAGNASFDDDAAIDVMDGPGGAPHQSQPHEKLLDADFYNAFPDDFDLDDMNLP
ncbi:MAG: hypothetical protein WDW36_007841 [Sanguina aurantia]